MKNKLWRIVIFTIVCLVLMLLLSKDCSGSLITNAIKGLVPNTEVVIKTDTVQVTDTLVQIEIDTFYQKQIVYLDKIIPSQPDTIFVVEEDTLNRYAGISEDSIAVIDYTAIVTGELINLQLGYKFKVPRLIEKTITETIRDSVTITTELYKGGFYLGSGFRYTPILESSISMDAGYLTKKGWYFGGSYEPSTKTIGVTAQKRIF